MERLAADAERASIKYKQVQYLQKEVGKVFEGIISGVTEWGIYVELVDSKCEGLIRLRDMTDDFYVFDEDNYRIIGKRNKKKYQLGDAVLIRVKRADLLKKQLDFTLVKTPEIGKTYNDEWGFEI
jgi:ribonuclease R